MYLREAITIRKGTPRVYEIYFLLPISLKHCVWASSVR